jgi:hypothetical protein
MCYWLYRMWCRCQDSFWSSSSSIQT